MWLLFLLQLSLLALVVVVFYGITYQQGVLNIGVFGMNAKNPAGTTEEPEIAMAFKLSLDMAYTSVKKNGE